MNEREDTKPDVRPKSRSKFEPLPTSISGFSAPVAFAVNTTVYPGGARKKESTACRASLAQAADWRDLHVERARQHACTRGRERGREIERREKKQQCT